jgi:hypothetical protein
MEKDQIIGTTLDIIYAFKERVDEVPGAWTLTSHYEKQLTEAETKSADDERRLYRAADEILKIIYDSTSDSLAEAVIRHLRDQISEALNDLAASSRRAA